MGFLSLLALGAGIFLALGVIVFGRAKSGYRWTQHTISELGETGSPYSMMVSLGLFLPVGLAMGGIALMATRLEVRYLAGSIAIGYLGAAFFPCDPGSPLKGSVRQSLHNFAGGVEYFGGAISFLMLANDHGKLWQYLGVLVFLGGIGLSLPQTMKWRGLIQRLTETALFLGLWAALVSVANLGND